MSENFNGGGIGWRKIKDNMDFFIALIPIIFFTVSFTIIMMLIAIAIVGTIFSLCWNISITKMFGFQKITIFQAFILIFTINCLRFNIISDIKNQYRQLKEKIFSEIPNEKRAKYEKLAKFVSAFFTAVFIWISIFVTIKLTMYSWNSILPQLINDELVKINFIEALSFSILFNVLFRFSKLDVKKSQDAIETEENAEKVTTE